MGKHNHTEGIETLCVSLVQFGKALGISKDGAKALYDQGFVRGMKVGRRVIIPKTEITRLMDQINEKEVRDVAEFGGQQLAVAE